ncbi:MAG: hypothetical protein Kow00108_15310 [Calditrichia bacterium]
MKKVLVFLVMFLITVQADVIKKSQSTVEFAGMGTLEKSSTTYLKGMTQLAIDDDHFKGKGFLGKMMGMAFPKGEKGKLILLNKEKMIEIDYEGKEYREMPIVNIFSQAGETREEQEPEENTSGDDHVKIIKNEFTVHKTGKSEKIAGYTCDEYIIKWYYEAMNKEDNSHYAMVAEISSFNAPEDATLRQVKEEETAFFKTYMEKLGLDKDLQSENMLGLNWFKLFSKLKQSQKEGSAKGSPSISDEDLQKLKKMSGYPLKVSGTFKMKNFNQMESAKEEEDEVDISKGLGGFLGKKLMKKKEKKKSEDGFETLFTFSNIIHSVSTSTVPEDKLNIPASFRQK